MNILLLSQFFSNTRGGGEYVFSLMAKLLAEKDNKIWIITNKVHGEKYALHKNIKIIFVPPSLEYKGGQPPSFKDNIVYTVSTIIKGLSIIKKEKIDIIHSNNISPALAGSILSMLTAKPHITVIHDIVSLYENYWKLWGAQPNISKLSVLLGPFFEKIIIRLKCSAIQTVSEATKDDLIKFGSKKPIYVIDNAIDIQEVKKLENVSYQFIYIGRLIFYKNLETVIKSLAIVKKSYPKVKLIIVGDGPHRKKLELLVSELNLNDNVQFTGYLTEEEKRQLLSTSQALIFPSLVEGFGLVILEAFQCRKPALVANVRPLSDIVEDNKTGFVIPPYDEKRWAEYITYIINNPEKTQQMGETAREILEKKYNTETMQNKILHMYNEVITKK